MYDILQMVLVYALHLTFYSLYPSLCFYFVEISHSANIFVLYIYIYVYKCIYKCMIF